MSASASLPTSMSAKGQSPTSRPAPRPNPYAPPGGFYASARNDALLAEKGQNLVTVVLVFLTLGQIAPIVLLTMGRLPFVPYGFGVLVALVLYRALYKGSGLARKFFLWSIAFLLGYLIFQGIRFGMGIHGWFFLGVMGAIPALVGLFFWKTPSVRVFYGVD